PDGVGTAATTSGPPSRTPHGGTRAVAPLDVTSPAHAPTRYPLPEPTIAATPDARAGPVPGSPSTVSTPSAMAEPMRTPPWAARWTPSTLRSATRPVRHRGAASAKTPSL